MPEDEDPATTAAGPRQTPGAGGAGHRGRRGLTAAAVADAAVDLADAEGLDALTLAALASRLDVRTPSLYHHVDGLAGARRAVTRRGLEGLGTALRDAAVGRSGADALRACADAYRAYAREHPGCYAAIQPAAAQKDDELRRIAERTTSVVFAVVRHWEPDPDRLVHLVRAVRSALHGFVLLEAGGGFGLPQDADGSFAVLVDVVLGGLDAHAAPD